MRAPSEPVHGAWCLARVFEVAQASRTEHRPAGPEASVAETVDRPPAEALSVSGTPARPLRNAAGVGSGETRKVFH